jgi:hypothetical protein
MLVMMVMFVVIVIVVIVRAFVVAVPVGHLMPPLGRIVRAPAPPVDSGSLPVSRGGR